MADEGKKSGAVNGQESEQQPNPDELTKFVSDSHLYQNKWTCLHAQWAT